MPRASSPRRRAGAAGRIPRASLSRAREVLRIEAEAIPGSTIGQGWSLTTGDGSITLNVPEKFTADLLIHTGDGHIMLDVPITVEGKYETRNIHGKLNGGGGLLNIHIGDGSIRLGKS